MSTTASAVGQPRPLPIPWLRLLKFSSHVSVPAILAPTTPWVPLPDFAFIGGEPCQAGLECATVYREIQDQSLPRNPKRTISNILCAASVASRQTLNEDQRNTWRGNRRLLETEPAGVKSGDFVLVPHLPRHGTWSIARVSSLYRWGALLRFRSRG